LLFDRLDCLFISDGQQSLSWAMELGVCAWPVWDVMGFGPPSCLLEMAGKPLFVYTQRQYQCLKVFSAN
jgi:hypothetical protein